MKKISLSKKFISTVLAVIFVAIIGIDVLYESSSPHQIPSLMSSWTGQNTTQTTGQLNIPVFYVDFPDCKYADDIMTAKEAQSAIFSADDENSLTSFYKTASFDQLSISGQVYQYTAQNNITDYENDQGFEALSMEVLSTFDNQIDYTDYDLNNDGQLDAFILCVPTGGDASFWYGCQATWYQNTDFSVDGVKPMYYVMCDSQAEKNDPSYFQKTLYHELGHCMGLPDYYKYNETEDYDAMHGIAGVEVMDDMEGDFSLASKLQLGWLNTSEVAVTKPSDGSKTFEIGKASTGDCLVIFKSADSDTSDFASEYFLIEYDRPEGNLKDCFTVEQSGIRIIHVEAEINNDESGYYYKYNGFSKDYGDGSIRCIVRVADDKDFLTKGDSVAYGTEGFSWYGDDGVEFDIEVLALDENKATVKITYNEK